MEILSRQCYESAEVERNVWIGSINLSYIDDPESLRWDEVTKRVENLGLSPGTCQHSGILEKRSSAKEMKEHLVRWDRKEGGVVS